MKQRCYAGISDTGLSCIWCVNRQVQENGIELDQAFCEKHGKPCEDMACYCWGFVGFKPDYRMSDEDEELLIEKLRAENS
jgi:hypothetical protein